jgi:hypothetical protein
LPQRSISLLQRSTIPAPRWQKILFHVKHSPIEKLPATLRTTLYQLVYFRIYDLNRECRNQIRDLPPSLAIDMNILATAANL